MIYKCIFYYLGIGLIINPLTSYLYVNTLGNIAGLRVLGESGLIKNTKTHKLLAENATEIKFINNLSDAGVLPILLLYRPLTSLSIVYSVHYNIKTTFNFIHYVLYDKSRVENGEFDRTI